MVHDVGYLDGIILLEQTITTVETKHANANIFFYITRVIGISNIIKSLNIHSTLTGWIHNIMWPELDSLPKLDKNMTDIFWSQFSNQCHGVNNSDFVGQQL